MTGGLPEVITASLDGKSEYEIDIIKQKILEVYEKELIKRKKLIDICRGIEVMEYY